MKIIKFVLFFVFIIFPFMVVNQINVKDQRKITHLKVRYDAAINAAVDDGAFALIMNEKQSLESGYESGKRVRTNLQQGMQAFYHTLYTNFDVADDPASQGVLRSFIPVVVVIGYDGYYILSKEEYRNAKGEPEVKEVWSEKKLYAYQDEQGNSLSFTLDDYVTAYDKGKNEWREGYVRDIKSLMPAIALLQNASTFEQVRRITIVNSIQAELSQYMNHANVVAKRNGAAYTFTLPTISQEEWNNTIDDVGIMAFVQGIPIGKSTYNNYALGGSRVLKKPAYQAAIKRSNGVKFFFRKDCQGKFTQLEYDYMETFGSGQAAAKAGYRQLSCSN
ncbi:hypothetical protein NV379_05450 [Paenibacillus sp. N1-5-1-14]|uniref:hypothetical protein n=1 Tax=Paenibacillus radicibacter TaxID=2972488 RepID=UPI002158E461|nr:hypothetical protein [Paenibacillus radicibacter]MCR8642098.1 hypothetical protein [Paenibacillus radicibacter]